MLVLGLLACDEKPKPAPVSAVRGFAAPLSVCGAFAPFLREPTAATVEARLAAEAARLAIADGTAFAKGQGESAGEGPAALLRGALTAVATACPRTGAANDWAPVRRCAKAVAALEGTLPAVGAEVGPPVAFPRRLAEWVRPGDRRRAATLRHLRDEPFDAIAEAFADPERPLAEIDASCQAPPEPQPLPAAAKDDPALTSMYAALARRSARRCTAWLGFRVTSRLLADCGAKGQASCPAQACELLEAYRADPSVLPAAAEELRQATEARCVDGSQAP